MSEDLILLTDSRSLQDASRTIFFALRTPTGGDGHRFIPELYSRGVRSFVVDNDFTDAGKYPGADFDTTDSPLRALQAMAKEKRKAFTGGVIGITGSRGKTMVKEWLWQLLSADHRVCRSPRSYNSQIGVPLSVWNLSPDFTLGIFEAGISRSGEMESLNEIIRPDIAVITNILSDHAEGFASESEKISEKLKLCRGARIVVYPADDSNLAEMIDKEVADGTRLVSWTLNDNRTAYVKVKASAAEGDTTAVTYSCIDGRSGSFTLAFSGAADIANAATCLSVMLAMKYDTASIARGMEELRPVGTRMQVSDGVNNCLIAHDDYTCDLPSLSVALDILSRRVTADRTLTAILSDIAHEQEDIEAVYREAGRLLGVYNVGRLIGVGPEISAHFSTIGIPGTSYKSTEDFLRRATPTDFHNELILVKGSATFEFRTIVNLLDAKTHETVLEVNLDAMVDNFNFFRSKLRPTTGIVAMVKASGYGAGSLELAKTLQAHGAAYLAVAVGDEGADLRKAGIKMPIMVLNPMVLNYKQLFDNRLEPEIFSFESLKAIIYEAERLGIKSYPIHIKLDTGMHRLGFREEDIDRLFEIIDGQDAVEIRSVFSHLATADCLDQDEYTLGQLKYYSRVSQRIVDHYPHRILRHVLNTAGILRFAEYQFDMVRLGIGLYGIPVLNNHTEDALRPISSLRSVIIALHPWEQTETIGYGRRGVLARKSLIATVPIGYADGFNRHCGRGNWKVAVNGHLCPTVGNICMDLCMIDVTDVPDVRIGDAVYIFGPENPATEMAQVLDTIPYECLTSVSPRVRRVYYRES